MNRVYSVTQITKYLKDIFSRDVVLRALTVGGELSNVKYHGSGHIYFTVKDSGASLSGVMFASETSGLDFRLEDGMKVEIEGRIGIYDKGGSYQIYASKIRKQGRGELYERFLRLKAELEERGMFADEYKQPVPEYIERLGVVTASTGAAVRDIINITRRRNPYVEIVLYPAKVQGEGAAESVAKGIKVLDKAGVDVIIVGRGGGSIEDLWAFNELIVAEAIFNSRTPIISAVGHETDVTIADFTADLRAPTPSAAAELAVFEYRAFLEKTEKIEADLKRLMDSRIKRDRLRLKVVESELKKRRPDNVIAEKKLYLAELDNKMRYLMREGLIRTSGGLYDRKDLIRDGMQKLIRDRKQRTAIYAERMKGVSPLEKLSHGYSYVADDKGRNVSDAFTLEKGDSINIYMKNGKVRADVREIGKTEY